ncbi:MAG: VWA domain-containing protein [Thermoanaerobaculia bacterium]|nr:VWA domain-containing protein [Thermoanaerobaculia bacterium]
METRRARHRSLLHRSLLHRSPLAASKPWLSNRGRPVASILCLPLLVAALAAAVPTRGQEVVDGGFEETTTVYAVEVPVRVLVRGEPLYGLEATDFEVFDNGVRQEVTAFGVIAAPPPPTGASAERTPSPPTGAPAVAPRRNFLLLFDFAYAGVGIIDSRRKLVESIEAARTFVDTALVAGDRVAVGYYSPLRGLKLLHDFTTDHATARYAVDVIDLIVEAKPKRLQKEIAGWDHLVPGLPGRRAKTPLGPNRASLEDLVAEARVWSQRGDPFLWHGLIIKHFAWGLRELTEDYDLPGMNYLVLFSRGPLFGDEESLALFYLEELFRDLRQENWSIQAVDTGGLGFGRDSLQLLAHATGGSLYTNSRDLEMLVGEVAEKTRLTYVLTFQVEDLAQDGSFREIEVRLVDRPKGTRITHRPGYYAPGGIDPKWRRSLRASGSTRQTDEPALTGLDPVALVRGREVEGRDDLAVVHDGFRYLFADSTNLERFLDSPDDYAIRLNGDCPVVDGVQGDPDFYLVHDGGIYIFSSHSARRRFSRQPEHYLSGAASGGLRQAGERH